MHQPQDVQLSDLLLDHLDFIGSGLGFFDRDPGDRDPAAGKGLPFWYPKGARVRSIIEDFWRKEHYQREYQLVMTPHIGDIRLWERSGHLQNFKERMYPETKTDEDRYGGIKYLVRPMNCPFHILVYLSQDRHRDELPFRLAELGTVYRFEKDSDLTGMLRLRGYTPDDAHIFCRRDQVEDEVIGVLQFASEMLQAFGFGRDHYTLRLSVDPGAETAPPEDWQWAQKTLKKAVKKSQVGKGISSERGRSLFYGAKLDIEIPDSKDRLWACSTVHIDTYLPERFDLTYGPHDERPVIIHRTILGSLERFVALLVEWYGGAFPVWLAPIQVRVIPVTERDYLGYAENVKQQLDRGGLRTEIDARSKTVARRIRDAHLEELRIPYILVVGPKEVSNETVSVRLRTDEVLGEWPLPRFIEMARTLAERKSLALTS